MIYRYTCSNCGLIVRVTNQQEGKEITACMCNAEIIEQQEQVEQPTESEQQ